MAVLQIHSAVQCVLYMDGRGSSGVVRNESIHLLSAWSCSEPVGFAEISRKLYSLGWQ